MMGRPPRLPHKFTLGEWLLVIATFAILFCGLILS